MPNGVYFLRLAVRPAGGTAEYAVTKKLSVIR
jgi:hypothetical protein